MYMNDNVDGGGGGGSNPWIKSLTSQPSFDKSLYQSNINLIDSNDLMDGRIGSIGRSSQPKVMKQMFYQSVDRMSQPSSSWIIRNCPPSLKFIAKFYQWFGFSFSGLVFIDDDHHNFRSSERKSTASKIFNSMNGVDHLQQQQQQQQQWFEANAKPKQPIRSQNKDLDEQKFGLRFKRFFFLALNIVSLSWMILFLSAIVADKWKNGLPAHNETASANQTDLSTVVEQEKIEQEEEQNNNNKTDSLTEFFAIISNINPSHSDINQLKPILRAIIESLLYGVLFDTIVMIFYLMIRGGKLIRLLIQIPDIELFDHSKRFAYRALGITMILSTIINILGLISFNSGAVEDLIDSDTDVWTKVAIVFQLVSNVSLFVYLSIVSILFIYTMMLFKFVINKLLNTFAAVNLDEIHMLKLKTKLSNLNDQFKEIIPYFALPLTVTFASNIFIIISSACFLMINTTRNQYTSFVFSLGLFAFLRLIVVACVGNLPTNICRDLIRTVYENLEQWSLNEWMCFMELKRLRKEFTVSIFSMYTVRQSSILAMLGFALNYIVILLQTENYSTTTVSGENGTDPAANETLNITKMMLLERDDQHYDTNDNVLDPNQIIKWLD